MTSQLILILALSQVGFADGISDVDVEGIKAAVEPINDADIYYISKSDSNCSATVEAECTAEVLVRFVEQSPEALRVSRVNGQWIVGQMEQSNLDYRRCMEKLQEKYDAARRAGERGVFFGYVQDLRNCRTRLEGFIRSKPSHKP